MIGQSTDAVASSVSSHGEAQPGDDGGSGPGIIIVLTVDRP